MTLIANIGTERKGRESESMANRRVREYTHIFVIQTTSLQSQFDILAYPGVPQQWSAHPRDTTAILDHLHPEQDKSNPYLWTITAHYTTDWLLEDFEDPSHTLPEISWETDDRQAIVPGLLKTKQISSTTRDKSGVVRTNVQTIQWRDFPRNSAGQIYDPPPQYDKSDPVLVVDYIATSFDSQLAMKYNNSVNSDPFLGADPECIRCKVQAKRFQWRDQFRWRITLRFAYRAEGWQPQVPDAGSFHRCASDPQGVAFKDRDGNPIIRLLDGTGLPLAGCSTPDAEPTDPVVFLTFTAYPSIPFAPLGIDSMLARVPTLNQ